jgi:hypothetical protein
MAGLLMLPLTGCVSLEEIALQSGADPVTWEIPSRDPLACHVPPPSDHTHPPGDRGWIGHSEKELVAALGPPAFRLGKPMHVSDGPAYVINVYADPQPTRAGCIDAYSRNPCGVVTGYNCR